MSDKLPPPAVLDWLRQLQESGRGLLDEIPTMVSVRKVAKKLGRGVKTLVGGPGEGVTMNTQDLPEAVEKVTK